MKYKILFLCFIVMLAACKTEKQNNENLEKTAYLQEKNQVKIMLLERGKFKKQIVSNGKLEALRKSELNFRNNGIINQIFVANGQQVKKGSIIASLDDFDAQQNLLKAKNNLQTSKINFQDNLIDMGFNSNDTISIPKDKLQLAKIRSGYATAQTNYSIAKQTLQQCKLIAPFNGTVANIKQQEHEQSGGTFCSLIDESVFAVSFQVLETELNYIKNGLAVNLKPFYNDSVSFKGKIIEINPVVESNGLINVKAVAKKANQVMEGMNVKVLIEKEIPNQFVVPKSAVVIRDNWEVLFKVVKGKAYWTYIKTIHENSDTYSVIPHPEKSSASLTPGDTVITSGNLNLAHESIIELD